MQTLIRELTALAAGAFEACGASAEDGAVVSSNRPDLGQFQTSGALAAGRRRGRSPRDVAECVVREIGERAPFLRLGVAGPGFVNITLSDDYLAERANAVASDARLGCARVGTPRTVVIDFGGPNIAKPMHVGHLRSSIIGDCLQRLFRFRGDHVISDIHMGDWGTPMGLLITELRRERPELPYFDLDHEGPYPAEPPVGIEDLEQMYPRASARFKADAETREQALRATWELQQGRAGYRALWHHFVDVSIAALKSDFGRLGVRFDLWLGESSYADELAGMTKELRERDVAQMSENAVVIPVAEATDEREVPPLMLEKSGGGFLYGTTDLATVRERVRDLQADVVLYVVDKRQSLHFEQVFRAARRTGFAGGAVLEHLAFGTVNGPDGKPFRTRAGGVMKLKDLLDAVHREALKEMETLDGVESYAYTERQDIAEKVGLAAVKFADLIHPRTSDYIFDLTKFAKFEGRTGPYLLYTGVRIRSILRKAKARGLAPGRILPPASDAERDLMLTTCLLPDAVERAYETRMPHHLCEFAYDLAQRFSRFYGQSHILTSRTRRGRHPGWACPRCAWPSWSCCPTCSDSTCPCECDPGSPSFALTPTP